MSKLTDAVKAASVVEGLASACGDRLYEAASILSAIRYKGLRDFTTRIERVKDLVLQAEELHREWLDHK